MNKSTDYLRQPVPRSTLSDGNKNRPSKVFGTIFQKIYNTYKHNISDSTLNISGSKRVYNGLFIDGDNL